MKKLTLILSMMIALIGFNANAAMYIVGQSPFGNWNPNAGVEMTDNGNGTYTYTATINGTVYFVFGDALADWDTFNPNHRYGPANGNEAVTAGVWKTTQKAGDHGAYFFQGSGEDYVFTFDETNHQFKVEGYVEPVVFESFTVAGNNADIFGTTWAPELTANDMTLDETDGLYKLVKNGIAIPAAYSLEYKVVANHSWDNNWGKTPGGDNQDYYFEEAGTYNLTFKFDLANEEVSLDAVKVEDGPVVEDYYIVAGTENLFGSNWSANDSTNLMTAGENGIYTWTKEGYEATAEEVVEFKVVANGNWNTCWPESDENGDNNWYYQFAQEGTYDIVITFNEETKEINMTATKQGGEEPPVEDYYIVAGEPIEVFGDEWNEDFADNTMTLVDGLYTWTKDSVELAANDVLQFKVVKNSNWDTCWPENNYEYTCPADGVYDLTITFNPDTYQVNFTATKQGGEEPPVADTYTVAGTENLCGSYWNPADTTNDMTLAEGLYTWTKSNVELVTGDTIEFKVVKNHSWQVASYPENNWLYVAPKDGAYDFVITFNPATEEVTFTPTVPGGEEPPVEMVYTVVGPESVFGTDWNATDTNNDMVKGEDGIYTWTKEEVTLYGNFNFKVVGNHDYAVYEWPMGYGNNYDVNVPEEAIYTIEITFDPEAADSLRITCTLTKTGDITPVEHVYTVAGTDNLFGSYWDVADETNNMVKGEDGIYTWTKNGVEFALDEEVKFKVVQDHAWTYAWPSSDWYWKCEDAGTYNVVITFDPSADDMHKITFTATKQGAVRGDVTGDGNVNMDDLSALINYLLTDDASNINVANAASCDGEEGIGMDDLSALINYLLTDQW